MLSSYWCLTTNRLRKFIPISSIKLATCGLLVCSAPLLEEEGYTILDALIADILYPVTSDKLCKSGMV